MQQKYKWGLSKLQMPYSAHLVVTDANYSHWKEFAQDLKASIEELKKDPAEYNSKGDAAMYGVAAKIPNKSLVGDALVLYLETIFEV